jgi:hypothetical protein
MDPKRKPNQKQEKQIKPGMPNRNPHAVPRRRTGSPLLNRQASAPCSFHRLSDCRIARRMGHRPSRPVNSQLEWSLGPSADLRVCLLLHAGDRAHLLPVAESFAKGSPPVVSRRSSRVGGRRGGVQGSLGSVRRFQLRARVGTPSLRLRPPPRRTGQADFRHPAHREGVIHRGYESVRPARAFASVYARR